jgi:pentapeptide MXKDX repeat protein
MTITTRFAPGISAAAVSLGLALTPAAFAQDAMVQDSMFRDSLFQRPDVQARDVRGRWDEARRHVQVRHKVRHKERR